KGERDTQWFDMGGGMGAVLAIISLKLRPFSFSNGKGSNGGKPTFDDKRNDGMNAVDFGTEAADEIIKDTTITTRRAVRIEPLSETAKMGIIEDVEVTVPPSKVDSVRQTDRAGLKRQLDELQR